VTFERASLGTTCCEQCRPKRESGKLGPFSFLSPLCTEGVLDFQIRSDSRIEAGMSRCP
jgi:hypothetical protein